MDWYIRTRLFNVMFNPFNGSDWKILLSKDGIVTKHIVEQFAVAIYNMQNRLTRIDAEVSHVDFSSLKAIKMRESYSMNVASASILVWVIRLTEEDWKRRSSNSWIKMRKWRSS